MWVQLKFHFITYKIMYGLNVVRVYSREERNRVEVVLKDSCCVFSASVKHGEEIQQESLKTTIQSAITDIEQGMYRAHRTLPTV